MKWPRYLAGLEADIGSLASVLRTDNARVRTAIYAKVLALQNKTTLPLDHLTTLLMKRVSDRVAKAVLCGRDLSLEQVVEDAAQWLERDQIERDN